MKMLIGKKIGMTQHFSDDGIVHPVTIVEVGPCVVTQVKTKAKDGVDAVQLGWGTQKRALKAQQGHAKGLPVSRVLKQFRVSPEESGELTLGTIVDCTQFEIGKKVTVTAQAKGHGFQGVVKRHGFHGSPKTHGHKDQLRMPGSSSAGGIQHVWRGKKMPGRMGNQQVTVKNLVVVNSDPAAHQLWLRGAVPGARGTLLTIREVRI